MKSNTNFSERNIKKLRNSSNKISGEPISSEVCERKKKNIRNNLKNIIKKEIDYSIKEEVIIPYLPINKDEKKDDVIFIKSCQSSHILQNNKNTIDLRDLSEPTIINDKNKYFSLDHSEELENRRTFEEREAIENLSERNIDKLKDSLEQSVGEDQFYVSFEGKFGEKELNQPSTDSHSLDFGEFSKYKEIESEKLTEEDQQDTEPDNLDEPTEAEQDSLEEQPDTEQANLEEPTEEEHTDTEQEDLEEHTEEEQPDTEQEEGEEPTEEEHTDTEQANLEEPTEEEQPDTEQEEGEDYVYSIIIEGIEYYTVNEVDSTIFNQDVSIEVGKFINGVPHIYK
jgi:hypothetical protein